MKFTLGWLKSHLDTTAPLAEIVKRLPMIGLEVEGVEDRARDLAPFIVVDVVEAKQHPDADRLRVCIVDTGKEKVQVVCGAPNARTGMKGVFARAGLTIPGTGVELKSGMIRGQASNGMLVSLREMGLGEDHSGIIDLPADAPVGQPFAPVLGLDDPVIDIAITPNRADCLGVRGVARDLAAAGLGTLKPLAIQAIPGRFASPIGIRIETPEAPGACPLFLGRHIRGVRNGPSPAWLQDRLLAVGLRPISTLVDITNLMTLDVNRPLHVFDAAKLKGGIIVRMARPGETLLALNGKTYALDETMTGVCDESGVLGLGGIIGGESTGCTEATTEVYVEAALFDPVRTATTGRKLEVLSDARYRFERGLDPAFVRDGLEMATKLILDLCGGEPSEIVTAGAVPEWQRSYTLRPSRVLNLGGLDLPAARSRAILESLGFAVAAGGETLSVAPPSWRGDIQGEADLVEEVLRIEGFESIPTVSMPRESALPAPAVTPAQRRVREARRALAGRGLVEAVTFSFMPSGHAALFGGERPDLLLANPISADLDCMRPSILPNLIQSARRNADRALADLALFEVGPQFGGDKPEDQRSMATGLRAGRTGPRHWAQPPRGVDAFDAKADALGLLAGLGLATENLQITADAPAWYHPGRSGTLRLGPKTILGWFGELHPGVLAGLDAAAPMVGFEVFLDAIPAPKAKSGRARPLLRLSPYQPVERDFAFVVDAGVPADQILRAAKGVDRNLIDRAAVFDVYEGPGVGEGRKSVAVTVRLQPTSGTLGEAEIEGVSKKIVAAVEKATGATLRS